MMCFCILAAFQSKAFDFLLFPYIFSFFACFLQHGGPVPATLGVSFQLASAQFAVESPTRALAAAGGAKVVSGENNNDPAAEQIDSGDESNNSAGESGDEIHGNEDGDNLVSYFMRKEFLLTLAFQLNVRLPSYDLQLLTVSVFSILTPNRTIPSSSCPSTRPLSNPAVPAIPIVPTLRILRLLRLLRLLRVTCT